MAALWWVGGVINGKAVCAMVGGRDLFDIKKNVIQELASLEGRKPDQITVCLSLSHFHFTNPLLLFSGVPWSMERDEIRHSPNGLWSWPVGVGGGW